MTRLETTFDLILGADVIFSMHAVPLLVSTIKGLCKRTSEILIAHEHRDPAVSEEFLRVMKNEGFRVKKIKNGKHDVEDEFVHIYKFKVGAFI